MGILLLALLQAAPAGGEVRFKRESDPAAVCMVMTAIESTKTGMPVTAFDNKPTVKRTDTGATVTWKRARAAAKSVKVTCQMNLETSEVTSVQVGGAEILTGPQRF
jgi:hypothetical protein